jgi:hypothetical protein
MKGNEMVKTKASPSRELPAVLSCTAGEQKRDRSSLCSAPSGPCRQIGPVPFCFLACEQLGCHVSAVLIDAYQTGNYGGTGQVAPWSLVRQLCDLPTSVPVILAGGLRPDNVAAAIEAARPAAVDTASGVESRPGRKDPQSVRDFVRNARAAFASVVRGDR